MFTIGIVGGVASGKSTVAEMFAELGAVVFHADLIAHDVLNREEVRDALVARWGPAILHADGSINRAEIAKIVFGDTADADDERTYLESVVHPMALRTIDDMRERSARSGQQVFVIDAPLLLEANWDSDCDMVVMVETPDEQRAANAARRGWPADEISRREETQMPISTKRHRADVVFDNSGSLAETRNQVDVFWRDVVVPQLGA